MLEFLITLVILYFIWALFIHPLIAMKVHKTRMTYEAHVRRLILAQQRSKNDGSEWHNDPDI